MALKFHGHYQKMAKFGCVAPMVTEYMTNDDGSVKEKEVKSNSPLPDADLFDLEANIKAKVNLEEQNTKIVGSSSADLEGIQDALNVPEQMEVKQDSKESE